METARRAPDEGRYNKDPNQARRRRVQAPNRSPSRSPGGGPGRSHRPAPRSPGHPTDRTVFKGENMLRGRALAFGTGWAVAILVLTVALSVVYAAAGGGDENSPAGPGAGTGLGLLAVVGICIFALSVLYSFRLASLLFVGSILIALSPGAQGSVGSAVAAIGMIVVFTSLGLVAAFTRVVLIVDRTRGVVTRVRQIAGPFGPAETRRIDEFRSVNLRAVEKPQGGLTFFEVYLAPETPGEDKRERFGSTDRMADRGRAWVRAHQLSKAVNLPIAIEGIEVTGAPEPIKPGTLLRPLGERLAGSRDQADPADHVDLDDPPRLTGDTRIELEKKGDEQRIGLRGPLDVRNRYLGAAISAAVMIFFLIAMFGGGSSADDATGETVHAGVMIFCGLIVLVSHSLFAFKFGPRVGEDLTRVRKLILSGGRVRLLGNRLFGGPKRDVALAEIMDVDVEYRETPGGKVALYGRIVTEDDSIPFAAGMPTRDVEWVRDALRYLLAGGNPRRLVGWK